ncbi:hypothetical protein AGLY_013883 [Aphis glycines]|uniref:Uncharacterized protein n=1 Tax=Aphis glycines TaxID=307491 RepID=A0A6G0T6N3_APHGL|nr:hypothetical protein AGLY_013883 [Aphis glycines]
MKNLLHINFKHMTGCFTLRQAPNNYLIVNVLKYHKQNSAHKNEPIDMANRIKNKKLVCSNIKINLHNIKAITIEKVKNTYIVPPSNFEFNVIITDPIQIITKTSANSGPPSPTCIESAMNVQSIKGPHNVFFSFKYKTCLNFIPTAFKSLIYSSSNVLNPGSPMFCISDPDTVIRPSTLFIGRSSIY